MDIVFYIYAFIIFVLTVPNIFVLFYSRKDLILYMANFKKGDWVQITPKSDHRWHDWSTTYDLFCGKIGYIAKIEQDTDKPDDRNEDLIQVNVYFSDNTFIGGPKWYFLDFKKKHLIITDRVRAKQQYFDDQAAIQTQKFEKSIKEKRDAIFRHIFSRDSADKKKKITKFEDDSNEDKLFEDWEEDTKEYSPII